MILIALLIITFANLYLCDYTATCTQTTLGGSPVQ